MGIKGVLHQNRGALSKPTRRFVVGRSNETPQPRITYRMHGREFTQELVVTAHLEDQQDQADLRHCGNESVGYGPDLFSEERCEPVSEFL